MFVRKKKNQSGSVSIQIIQKSKGNNKVVKSVGCSKEEKEIKFLVRKAHLEIPKLQKQQTFDFGYGETDKNILEFVESKSIIVSSVGANVVLGKIFDSIGFNKIKEPLFKKLVIARIVYPVSKLKTKNYWERHFGYQTSIQSVYDSLDRLHKRHKTEIENISYTYTKRILRVFSQECG